MAGHMTPTRVAEVCRQAKPRRVILTHQYPPVAELDAAALVHKAGFDGPVIAAHDGLRVQVPATKSAPAGSGPEVEDDPR
jgi:ribonuclease BN (tRNA processing enzyme)